MKFNKFLFPAALSFFLGFSCSGPVYVQKDPSVNLSNYRNYMWVEGFSTILSGDVGSPFIILRSSWATTLTWCP